MEIDFDVDIDMANREDILKILSHTPASIDKNGKFTKHNTGVYFQSIPKKPIEQFSAIDHKQAQAEGWFKVDFLNNHIYANVTSPEHLTSLAEREPVWELLEHKEIVEQLNHIRSYHYLMLQYKPKSIEQLAMLLAIIRPAKKHLIGKSWTEIEKEIWTPPTDGAYFYKKSHSIAFALSIVVQLNILVEGLV